jgi:hypothetical protein
MFFVGRVVTCAKPLALQSFLSHARACFGMGCGRACAAFLRLQKPPIGLALTLVYA